MSGIKKGKEIGFEQGKEAGLKQVIKSMLDNRMKIEEIEKLTGISRTEIKRLKNE